MLPLVSGKCTELDAMLACSWRDEYISKTVSRRNLSAPWNVINETEIGQSLCFPKGMETCSKMQNRYKNSTRLQNLQHRDKN